MTVRSELIRCKQYAEELKAYAERKQTEDTFDRDRDSWWRANGETHAYSVMIQQLDDILATLPEDGQP